MKLNVAKLQQLDTVPQTTQNQKCDTSYHQSSTPGTVGRAEGCDPSHSQDREPQESGHPAQPSRCRQFAIDHRPVNLRGPCVVHLPIVPYVESMV